MVINVYERCFRAEAEFSGVRRNGALVMLTSDSEAGNIRYTAAVTFFPHNDDEDFAISYDAYFEKEMYSGRGQEVQEKRGGLSGTAAGDHRRDGGGTRGLCALGAAFDTGEKGLTGNAICIHEAGRSRYAGKKR